jgi:iron complex outermembrane receptor protein
MTTKLPSDKESYSANFTIGSFNTYRFAGDATGRVAGNDKLRYRLVVGYENSEHLQRFNQTQNFFVNPSFTFLPTPKTNLTLTASYFHQNQQGGGWYNRGIMAPGGNVDLLDRSWTHHEKNDKHHDYLTNIQLLAKHAFSDKFSLHLLARSQHYDYLQQYHHIRWNSYVDSTKRIRREFRDFADKTADYFINAYSMYKLSTGKINHTLLTGVDYNNSYRRYTYKSSRANVPGLDILNPVYGLGEMTNYRGEAYNALYEEPTSMLGFYVQDQLEIGSRLKALLGVRYDRFGMNSVTTDRTASVSDPAAPVSITKDTSSTSALIPRIGLVYQPISSLSLYTSYSQSFEPQYSNLTNQGGPFDPERGKQVELGAKAGFFKNRLQATAAVYQIRKVNILTASPEDPELLTEGNEATSKGIELTVSGSVFDGLDLIANYSYNETRITKSLQAEPNTIPWFENAPNTVANLWAVYSFQVPALSGLSLGGGLYHVGKRYTFKPGFVVPAYTTLDGMVSYRYKQYALSLNLYNLTNKRYFSGAFHEDALWVGAPRSFRLNVGVSF